MQEYRLDDTANVVLRFRGTLAHNHTLNFVDATGRLLLVLACRIRQVRGRKVAELLLNAVDSSGSWGAELSAEVPEDALSSGLELRFRSWRVEVLLGGQLRLACNPTASFGPGANPALAVRLQTNCAASDLSLMTGLTYGPALAEPNPMQGEDLTLVILNSGDPDLLRAEFADLSYRFREIIVVNPKEGLKEPKDGKPLLETLSLQAERAINAALARVTTPYVAIASGKWSARDFGRSLTQYTSTLGPDSFMPMTMSLVMRPGEYWGLLLPAHIGGRPALSLRNGIIVIEPKLTSAAYWQVSRQWNAAEELRQMRQDSASQPIVLNDAGRVVVPVHRLGVQAYALIPGSTDMQDWPYSGLRVDRQPLTGILTPRRILIPLRTAAEESCSSHFMLWTTKAGSVARSAAWLQLGLLYEIGIVLGKDNRPVGLMVSRDFLAPSVLAEFDAMDSFAFNQPCTDLTDAIERLVAMAARMQILVVRNHVDELDAIHPLKLQGRLQWLATSSVIEAQLAPRPLPKLPPPPPPPPLAPGEVAALEDEAPVVERIPAQPDLQDANGAFEALALQSLQRGMITEICQYAISADLRRPTARFVERLVNTFQNSGWADDLALRAKFMEILIARNYHVALAPLLKGLLPRAGLAEVSPALLLRLKGLDIQMRCRDLDDQVYANPENRRLPSSDGPHDPDALIRFLDAITFYLALRRDWRAILDLVAHTKLPELAGYGFHERWVTARIETGQTEGLAAEMQDLHQDDRLTTWCYHRMLMRLARANRDRVAEQGAVQQLLRDEVPLTPLLQAPTKFRQIGSAAPDGGPSEIACIIVARNEFGRLKWLHSYYRRLGVDRFFLIDNVSDDETIDYFSRQPDVTVLQTDENYRDSCYGVKWHNEVAEAWLEGRWVLTVDADEALVFEGAEAPGSLRDLCARLDAEGSDGFFAPMIDMYSEGRLDETQYAPGDSLIERFPMFDGGPYRLDPSPGYPALTMSGGVRIRLFWNDRHDIEVPHLAMQKVPLVRWRRGFRYLASTHDMTPLTVSRETGALLHFKFMPDFHARAMEEVRRNQHYEGAREYRIYAEILNDPANRSFVYPGSVRYEGPQSLEPLGLITRPKTAISTAASQAWLQSRQDLPSADDAGPTVAAEGTARNLATSSRVTRR